MMIADKTLAELDREQAQTQAEFSASQERLRVIVDSANISVALQLRLRRLLVEGDKSLELLDASHEAQRAHLLHHQEWFELKAEAEEMVAAELGE